jgi:hypothetical protein
MKNILYKNRALNFMKHLQTMKPHLFILINKLLVRYIKRWKSKKLNKSKAFIVRTLMVGALAQKMRFAFVELNKKT